VTPRALVLAVTWDFEREKSFSVLVDFDQSIVGVVRL
jgi:hypothetical protein